MRQQFSAEHDGKTYKVTFDGRGDSSQLALIQLQYTRTHNGRAMGVLRSVYDPARPKLRELNDALIAVVKVARRKQVIEAFSGADPNTVHVYLHPLD